MSLQDGANTSLTWPQPFTHGGWAAPDALWHVIRQYRDDLVAVRSTPVTAVMRRVTQDWRLAQVAAHYGCTVVDAFDSAKKDFKPHGRDWGVVAGEAG